MVHPCMSNAHFSFVSEDTLTSVGEDGKVFLAVQNKSACENIKIRTKTVIDKTVLTTFVLEPISVETYLKATA